MIHRYFEYHIILRQLYFLVGEVLFSKIQRKVRILGRRDNSKYSGGISKLVIPYSFIVANDKTNVSAH